LRPLAGCNSSCCSGSTPHPSERCLLPLVQVSNQRCVLLLLLVRFCIKPHLLQHVLQICQRVLRMRLRVHVAPCVRVQVLMLRVELIMANGRPWLLATSCPCMLLLLLLGLGVSAAATCIG
jgi:hypothetical protein